MTVRGAHRLIFAVVRQFWLLYTIFLWAFWLASIPAFLQQAATGTLPAVDISGSSLVQMAFESAAAWGVSVTTWAWINTVVAGLSFLVFTLVAFLIWRRVRTGFGLLTAFVLLAAGGAPMDTALYSAGHADASLVLWQLGAIVWPLFFPWLYLFPNGRAVPRRLLWLLVPLYGLFGMLFLLYMISVFLPDADALVGIVAVLQPAFETLVIPIFSLVFGAQIYRYVKVSTAIEKRQTRWFLLGLGVVFLPASLFDLLRISYPAELGTLTFAALPLAIGISILRYRLWDIDVIIRKTLVYALLTGLLALFYFGMVILLRSVFDTVSGQQSPLVIVTSTLIIAALFAPLRRRVQAFIDRRFYRKKYDAQRVLAHFAQTARDEVELEALTVELSRVVNETMRPETVMVWLRQREGSKLP